MNTVFYEYYYVLETNKTNKASLYAKIFHMLADIIKGTLAKVVTFTHVNTKQ